MMMLVPTELTRDELRFWSRYIRDVLSPLIRNGGGSDLKAQELNDLEAFLDKLASRGSVDKETLRFSKLHIALMGIASSGSGWMQNVVMKVDALLEGWKREFGPLHELRSDLWGPGGRLHGLKRLNEKGMDDGGSGLDQYKERKQCVSVPVAANNSWCSGDLGFEVGEYATTAFLVITLETKHNSSRNYILALADRNISVGGSGQQQPIGTVSSTDRSTESPPMASKYMQS